LDRLKRLHASIKGVRGAQTSGASIVSFNEDAFNSYGKVQGANAPVGQEAAFAYTTALNRLLAQDSPQRLQVGDASTVFWTSRQIILETAIVDLFGEARKDDPDRNVRAIRALYESPTTAVLPSEEREVRFYALGLSPNAARVSIRFWHVSSVSTVTDNIRKHFDDLRVVRPGFEQPYFSLFRLLVSTAALGKSCGQVRGPVQVTFGRSVDPVVTLEHSITRMAVTTEAESENQSGDNRTMGRKHTIPYGLYAAHGFVSAFLAKQTGFSSVDLDLLFEALSNMLEHDRSTARGEMSTRGLYVFQHESELGNAPAFGLFSRLSIKRKDSAPARSFDDYSVLFDNEAVPVGDKRSAGANITLNRLA
jgi:hypothetical protein